MKVSIVTPTLNEEKYLPKLLKSLDEQTFKDFEVIVADAGSKDKTTEIAKEHNAKVVKGGLPGPGRNAGAKIAKGEYIFFLDADVVLEKDFLEKAYKKVTSKKISLATCKIGPLDGIFLDKIIHSFLNVFIRLTRNLKPSAFGICIIVKKDLFEKIHGFNEKIKLCEDSEFVQRASKVRRFHFIASPHVKVSMRRFEKEGRLRYCWKGLKMNLYRLFIGDIKKDLVDYEWGKFE